LGNIIFEGEPKVPSVGNATDIVGAVVEAKLAACSLAIFNPLKKLKAITQTTFYY
jgi:hypothetical protein